MNKISTKQKERTSSAAPKEITIQRILAYASFSRTNTAAIISTASKN
jgi:hypothetical protein